MRVELNTKFMDFQLCIWGHTFSILKSTVCPSVRPSIRACVRPFITMDTHTLIFWSPLIITKLFRLVFLLVMLMLDHISHSLYDRKTTLSTFCYFNRKYCFVEFHAYTLLYGNLVHSIILKNSLEIYDGDTNVIRNILTNSQKVFTIYYICVRCIFAYHFIIKFYF